jgi:tetratricopeptide (TPR) repeat protein
MTEDSLSAGRAAIARNDWETGYSLLARGELQELLTAADFEGVGEAAFWTNRPRDCIRYRERSFAAYAQGNLGSAAARVAVQLAWNHMAQGSYAVGGGWFAKANRLLTDEPECREHGELTNSLAHIDIAQGKLESALARARDAFEIGQRLGDGDLQAAALNTEGSVLIRLGQITEGMARIDESMASAIGGELTPFTTASIYCTTISACQRIGDLRRATEWTDAAEHCAATSGMQDFPGDCRAHRVSILRVNGQWDDAEAAAGRAVAVEGAEPSHVATVHQEVGEMRLFRGRFDAADEAFCRAEDLGRSPQPGRALLCLAQGEIEAAVSFINTALADDNWDRLARARLLPAQVEIALAAGRLTDARQAADELRDIAGTYDTIALAAAAGLAQGRVLVAEGDAAGAVRCLRDAMRLWLDLPAPFEAARSRFALAGILRDQGSIDDAQIEARAALTAFERLGAAPDVQRARQLLDELDKAKLARAGKTRRVTRTFMFTDIVGSTNLLEAMGDEAWRNLVRWHDQALRTRRWTAPLPFSAIWPGTDESTASRPACALVCISRKPPATLRVTAAWASIMRRALGVRRKATKSWLAKRRFPLRRTRARVVMLGASA